MLEDPWIMELTMDDFLSQEEVDALLKGIGDEDLPLYTLNTVINKLKEDIKDITVNIAKLKVKLDTYQYILKMLECVN